MADAATMPARATVLRAGPGRLETIRRRMRGKTAFKIGLAIVALLIIVGALAPVIAPFDPTAIHASDGLKAPSGTYWLGTDDLGRDIFSRIVYAARTSLLVALGSVIVASLFGVPLGLIAGFL